ncbi:hypothetical protein [Moorena producens]|nr:hypothetical protein [Moorena producens]
MPVPCCLSYGTGIDRRSRYGNAFLKPSLLLDHRECDRLSYIKSG